MSAPEFGQRAAHGAEKAPKPSQKCREISSSEISTNNSAASAVVVQTFLWLRPLSKKKSLALSEAFKRL